MAHFRASKNGPVAAALCLALSQAAACDRKKVPALKVDSGDQVAVVRVNRGHELVVSKNGIEATVRLVGIYTFAASIHEKSDISVFAKQSKAYVEKELVGTTVTLVLERAAPDERGRYLGFIELLGSDFNERMIEKGYAVVYTEFPFSREEAYFDTEAEPRDVVRAMWGGRASPRRLKALRQTWAAVRESRFGKPVNDPLLAP